MAQVFSVFSAPVLPMNATLRLSWPTSLVPFLDAFCLPAMKCENERHREETVSGLKELSDALRMLTKLGMALQYLTNVVFAQRK